MPKTLSKIKAWHETTLGYLAFAVAELILAYIIAIRAIDTGSLWQYLLFFVFLIGGIQNIVKLVFKIIHDNKHKSHQA